MGPSSRLFDRLNGSNGGSLSKGEVNGTRAPKTDLIGAGK